MARPAVPFSRTAAYVRGHSTGALSTFGADEDGQPLSSAMMHDEICSSFAALWLAQGQTYVNWFVASGGSPLTFSSADTAGKASNGAFTYLRSFSWVCRLLPDGRPEPVRVVVRAKKASGGDPNFYVRAVLRFATSEPISPWPIPQPGLKNAWNVGQAVFTSSSLAETEIDAVLDAIDMKGIMQIHPSLGLPPMARYSREGGITTADDFEPVEAPMVTLDLYGGFSSGPSGTPELHGCLVRSASYGAKDADDP